MRLILQRTGLSLVLLMLVSPVLADTNYDEGSSGDLSDDNLSPTELVFDVGTNSVIGETTNAPLDRDFWTFEIPTYRQLDAIVLTAYTSTDSTGDQVSFMAIEAGPQISSVSDTSTFLGAALIGTDTPGGAVGDDVLDDLGGAPLGGSGFVGPLGGGQYSVWFQETTGDTTYQFDFLVSQVPEPSGLGILAVAGLVGYARRRR